MTIQKLYSIIGVFALLIVLSVVILPGCATLNGGKPYTVVKKENAPISEGAVKALAQITSIDKDALSTLEGAHKAMILLMIACAKEAQALFECLRDEDNIHKDCLKELTGYHTLAIFRDMAEDNFTRVSYEYCFKRLKQ